MDESDQSQTVPQDAAIREWSRRMVRKKKSLAMRGLAMHAASSVVSFHSYNSDLLDRLRMIPIPPEQLVKWERFWEYPHLAWRLVADHFLPEIDGISGSRLLRMFLIGVQKWDRMSPTDRRHELASMSKEALREVVGIGNEIAFGIHEDGLSAAYFGESLYDEELPEEESPQADHLSAMLFCLQVCIPCQFELREHPQKLFRRALDGHRDALIKLLRLDDSVRFLPKMKELMETFLRSYTPEERACTREPINGFGAAFKKKKSAKALIAGWIIDFSQRLAKLHPRLLKAFDISDIRTLFDAIARDRSSLLTDQDIPADITAFRQTVKRYRKEFGVEKWNIFETMKDAG